MGATAFPAAAIVSGTIATSRLGSGTADASSFLRGDQTWAEIVAGAAWGDITGTLSTQTDLQAALDAKLNTSDASLFAAITGATFTGAVSTRGDGNAIVRGGLRVVNLDTGSSAGAGLEARMTYLGSEAPFGFVGFRRWPTSPSNFGEFVVVVGANGSVGSPTLTLDVNGVLSAPTISATSTIAAGLTGMHQNGTGTTPGSGTLRHGMWSKDTLDLYFRAANSDYMVLSWDGRFGVGYSSRNSFTQRFAVNGSAAFVGPVSVGVYTFATVPSASTNAGATIRISDRSQRHAYSDGSNWRFTADDVIIS